jgi:uncharacterized membrane protein
MTIRRHVLPITAALLLSACASLPGLRDETPLYAGQAGLRVHESASAGSRVVGTLALHERVLRSEVERGWAHVRSDRSGLKGWVDNARLLNRIPSAHAPAASPDAQPAAATGPAAATPVAPDTQAASPAPDLPAEPVVTTPEETPPPAPDPPKREPAVFDPF